MGRDDNPQFKSRNGCIYIYNHNESKWYKYCPTDELPFDVKEQIKNIKETADKLKDIA